jgi:hypothetical protein
LQLPSDCRRQHCYRISKERVCPQNTMGRKK